MIPGIIAGGLRLVDDGGGGPVDSPSATWRLVFGYQASNKYRRFSEIEMRETSGGPDVLIGATPTASSEAYPATTWGVAHANDGNPATTFAWVNTFYEWVQFDLLAEASDIYSVTITQSSAANTAPENLILQKKVGVEWLTTGFIKNIGDEPAGVPKTYIVTPVTVSPEAALSAHKYWRFQANSGNAYFSTQSVIRRWRLRNGAGDSLAQTIGGVPSSSWSTTAYPVANLFAASGVGWAATPPKDVWAQFEFTTPQIVKSYEIEVGPNADDVNSITHAWSVLCSDNGVDWTVVHDVVGQLFSGSEVKTYNL